ncbi:hypothetical protein PINS_up019324 [Pythium insidiosum]|nr:hypothetical protein PINS_up019324 [Pythium insidiosum]
MVPSAIVMTPPSVVVVESKQEFESPDFTDEAWEQIDQLVFEATQRKEDGALASQVAASPQVHASAIVSPHQPTLNLVFPPMKPIGKQVRNSSTSAASSQDQRQCKRRLPLING